MDFFDTKWTEVRDRVRWRKIGEAFIIAVGRYRLVA